MQERFCRCGQKIVVQFATQGGRWRVLFWCIASLTGERIQRCPTCSSALSIDELY